MLKFITIAFLFISLSACNVEYWWSRGQAPSPEELLQRAANRVSEIHGESKYQREDVYNVASSLIEIINRTPSFSSEVLDSIDTSLKSLEGKLSYGNRAPYYELCGQLRHFQNDKELSLKVEPLRLYLARVLFFLASEMKVPAPDKVANS